MHDRIEFRSSFDARKTRRGERRYGGRPGRRVRPVGYAFTASWTANGNC